MQTNRQWSISRLFLWGFVAALIASHLPKSYPQQIVGLTDFELDGSDVKRWVSELDPSASVIYGGAGSSNSGDVVDSDTDYTFTLKTATSQEVFNHLQFKIREQLNDKKWSIPVSRARGNSFDFQAHNGDTHLRIFAWLVPNTDGVYVTQSEESGETTTTTKTLRICYLMR